MKDSAPQLIGGTTCYDISSFWDVQLGKIEAVVSSASRIFFSIEEGRLREFTAEVLSISKNLRNAISTLCGCFAINNWKVARITQAAPTQEQGDAAMGNKERYDLAQLRTFTKDVAKEVSNVRLYIDGALDGIGENHTTPL